MGMVADGNLKASALVETDHVRLHASEDGGFDLEISFTKFSAESDSLQSGENYHCHIPPGGLGQRVATLSTTHVAMLDKAGALDSWVGSSFLDLVRNQNAVARIETGLVEDLSGSEEVDFEKMVELQPDIFLVYPYGNTDFSRLEAAGIACIPICEYLETNPLSRAEWVRIVGALTGHFDEATEAFHAIGAEYNSLAASLLQALSEDTQASEATRSPLVRPTVFAGSHSNGIWYAPPDNSFIAAFIRDAGGRYLFEGQESDRNLEFQFEEIFDLAYETDWWGKVVFEEGPLTLASIRANDDRFAQLKSFREKQVFYCNAAEADYFGDGVMEPEVILKDLIHIFHPDFLTSHVPVYFKTISE
jgi:iron complex transport system substrate-binding protein